jgi:hypothetical protein
MAANDTTDGTVVGEVLAAIAYGERLGAKRAQDAVRLAPDARSASLQQHIADRERQNSKLVEARLSEVGGEAMIDRYQPFFDAFFEHTEPTDWVEAQTFHYVGDALVSDFADALVPLVDTVSGEIVRRALGNREHQEEFALEELTRAMQAVPELADAIRRYSRRIMGEAFTQTSRALEQSEGLKALLGHDADGGKQFILTLLERHRQRLDRLGIEPLEDD